MVRTKAIALVATAIAVGFVSIPKDANAGWYPLRLYEHTGYDGYEVALYESYNELRWSKGFNDLTSSVYNQDSVAWVLYDDTNYADRRYCIKPGQRISNLHSDAWKFGDKISSAKRLNTTSCAGYPTF